MSFKPVSIIILTKNEERHLERAIRSIEQIAGQVIVVDSGSTDKTLQIAAESGAEIYQHAFINQAKQFQWALENIPIRCPWTMRLDADEIIEPDLARNILSTLPALPNSTVGIRLKRKHIFMDRWIRFGGRYPLLLLRIWRTGKGRIEDRWMDEHIIIDGGNAVTLDGGFADHNLNDLTWFIDKHNRYATREAIDVINGKRALFHQENLTIKGTSLQTAMKRQLKEGVFNKLPYTLSSTLYFIWRYIFQFGMLDGKAGFVYHALQGYWYRLLVGAKVEELEGAIQGLTDKTQILKKLSVITGHDLFSDNE